MSMDWGTTYTGGEELYADVCMGEPQGVDTIKLDVSAMTVAEVDAYGFLKPGVPLKKDGTLVGNGEAVYGVVPNAVKLRGRTNNANLGADTNDVHVAVATSGSVQKKAIQKNLGRALTANELAGFAAAGCKIALVG